MSEPRMSPDECTCEFDACDCDRGYADGVICPPGECPESWHYLRVCALCGCEWGALHCPHDGAQNPCPGCGWIDEGKRTPSQLLGFTDTPGVRGE